MNRHDIQLLQQIRNYPLLTITMPTHRTSPENQQDPIRLKNLVVEATDRLLQEFTKRELEPLLTRLDELVNTIDHRHNLEGLALFVGKDFGQVYHSPFELQERVVVNETFATRDLIFALNHSPRYWVLVLSEQPTRLYEGMRDTLVEIKSEGFPMTHTGPGGETALPGGFGIRRSAYRDENHRKFFREVGAAFTPFAADDPLPLIVIGVDRYLAFFNEVTDHRDAITASLSGNHDEKSAHELGELVWPLIEAHLAEKQQHALSQLDIAVSEQKYVSTVGEVWRLAQEGRGRLLLVEEDFHVPARVDDSGKHLLLAEDATEPGVMDDAVDEIIEEVLSKQGEVVFVENGKLTQHQRIALILRY